MKQTALNLVMLTSVSLLVALITYIINLWLFSSNSVLFLEGLIFILGGILLLLGSGGINRFSQRTAVIAAATEAIYGKEQPKPSEIFRLDAWKPKGFTRLGLILIIAGILMLVFYFLSF